MPIIQSLRDHFARALRNLLPGRVLAEPKPPTADLTARMNEIDSFYAPTLQRNLRLSRNPTGPLPEFDWACLMANRVGDPAGLRTLFRLKWTQGTGQHIYGTAPRGTLLSSDTLDIILPLEDLLPKMIAERERIRKTNIMEPCALAFDQPCLEDVQELVKAYRALCPRETSHLRLVK